MAIITPGEALKLCLEEFVNNAMRPRAQERRRGKTENTAGFLPYYQTYEIAFFRGEMGDGESRARKKHELCQKYLAAKYGEFNTGKERRKAQKAFNKQLDNWLKADHPELFPDRSDAHLKNSPRDILQQVIHAICMGTKPLSIRDVQAELNVSRRTVGRYLQAGLLRGFRLPTGVWRIPASEVARLRDDSGS